MTADNDMVERVARAIHFRGDDQGDAAWNHCQSWYREIAREQARAAIEAMREPTFGVVEAVQSAVNWSEQPGHYEFISREEAVETWQAGIDAALKRGGE